MRTTKELPTEIPQPPDVRPTINNRFSRWPGYSLRQDRQYCQTAVRLRERCASIRRISEEMDQLHLIFGQVHMLLEGHAKKRPSRSRLTMLPLHHLMTILSGCVLAYSDLDEKLSSVAGLARGGSITSLGARVQWALWKEAEAGVILVDLERYKSSLHIMLTIIQW